MSLRTKEKKNKKNYFKQMYGTLFGLAVMAHSTFISHANFSKEEGISFDWVNDATKDNNPLQGMTDAGTNLGSGFIQMIAQFGQIAITGVTLFAFGLLATRKNGKDISEIKLWIFRIVGGGIGFFGYQFFIKLLFGISVGLSL